MMKTATLLLMLALAFHVYSQCPISQAYEASEYQFTLDTLGGGISKYVQSEWIRIGSNYSALVELYYVRDIPRSGGRHFGRLTINFGETGPITNGKVYFEDGSSILITPGMVDWEDSKNVIALFELRGGLLDYLDSGKINGSVVETIEKPGYLTNNTIDLRKLPTKFVFLAEVGTVEILLSDAQQLSLLCVLNRYETPYTSDIDH